MNGIVPVSSGGTGPDTARLFDPNHPLQPSVEDRTQLAGAAVLGETESSRGQQSGQLESISRMLSEEVEGPLQMFGPVSWERYFGTVGKVPLLPSNFMEILHAPCPFWPAKKVYETHVLALVPETVDGKPLTLDWLGELVQHPKGGGKATQYIDFRKEGGQADHGSKPAPKSHWVLMTRDVLVKTGEGFSEERRAIVARYPGYATPLALEAATLILTCYVKTGNRLYPSDPLLYTDCQDRTSGWQLVVGSFWPETTEAFLKSWPKDLAKGGAMFRHMERQLRGGLQISTSALLGAKLTHGIGCAVLRRFWN